MADINQYEPLWGSWYIDAPIGEGSFGKVYRVKREEFGRTYYSAVKLITIPQSEADLRQAKADGLDGASMRSYFRSFVEDIVQEIDLMSEFKGNSNIVSFEDYKIVEKQNGFGYDILIRMELLTSLPDRAAEKPLTESEVIKLGIHICRALELCAQKNVIHRDIKPDNIFVSQYGDYKLGDFGIARQIERTTSGLSKKGTYTYMAPEVFKGGEYGASVDVYSLGIVMYRYLNRGRTPFMPDYPAPITPRSREEALSRRMNGERVPPIAGVGRALNAAVLKACAYDRAARCVSAAEMRAALEAIAGGGGGAAKSPARPVPPPRAAVVDRERTNSTVGVFGGTARSAAAADRTGVTEGVFDAWRERDGKAGLSKGKKSAGKIALTVFATLMILILIGVLIIIATGLFENNALQDEYEQPTYVPVVERADEYVTGNYLDNTWTVLTADRHEIPMTHAWVELPDMQTLNSEYDLIAGKYPESYSEIVICTDANGNISQSTASALGLSGDNISFDEALSYGCYIQGDIVEIERQPIYQLECAVEVVGIIRSTSHGSCIGYTGGLTDTLSYTLPIPEMPVSFTYASGYGGWGTDVTINPDGTFSAYNYDSDMGLTGEGYPNGTEHECYFNGAFTEIEKVGEYEYSMKVDYVNADGIAGDTRIEDGVLFITENPRGFENAANFLLFLPGMPTYDMPSEYIDQMSMLLNWGETPNALPFYGLYNIDAQAAYAAWG